MEPIKIAICYDFDGTLIHGNMQENSFIPNLGMSKEDFWKEVNELAEARDMDEVLAYMHLMIEKSLEKKVPFTQEVLKEHGKQVQFFPGVEQWFDLMDQYAEENRVVIEHYIISSGIDDMIKGSPIGDRFKYIFASGFLYDRENIPHFAARSINYTTKTQYLFRISKGILNSWDRKVNKKMKEDEFQIPFSQMIYLGDGETDVPAMKMLNYQGGYTLAVYPPKGSMSLEVEKKKDVVQQLQRDNRTQFIAEADYSEGKQIHKIMCSLIQRIASEVRLQMNLKA